MVAQMFGKTDKAAAEQIKRDFHLDQPVDNRPDPNTRLRRKEKQQRKALENERWNKLCEAVQEADERLAQYTPETADAEFDMILAIRCRADQELNVMWEDMQSERTR